MSTKKHVRRGTRSVALPVLGLGVGLGLVASRAANAANAYLDVNGTLPGSGATVAGATYNWDDPIWTTDATGVAQPVNYTDGDFPRFAAAADATVSYTVSLATNHTCVGMFLEDGAVNSTLTLQPAPTTDTTIGINGGAAQGFIVRGSSNLKIFNRIVDGNLPGGAISFSTSGGTGSGSLFLYGNNSYTGGTILATSGGANINSSSSFGTGPISWSVGTAVIADPTDPSLTGPITLTNTINCRTTAAASTLIVTGAPAAPIEFAGNFNLTPGQLTTISIGNTTFPNAVTSISGPISGNAAALVKGGTGLLTVSNPGNSYTNGTIVNAGKLLATNADALPPTAITVNTTGTAQYQAGLPKAATMFNVVTAGTGQLDLTDNSMVITGMALADVTALVKTGFNAGAWNGPGINSSTAHANTITAVGVADDAILGKTSFKGVTLGGSEILVKYTYYGDADLSGATTLDDFTLFLNGYQTGGTTWLQGDFDYSGTVTLDDFTLFLGGYQNQGAPLSALEAMINSVPMSSSERQAMLAAVEAVPEPASVALIGLSGLGLATRRRRQRC